jgi:hypothetical protein
MRIELDSIGAIPGISLVNSRAPYQWFVNSFLPVVIAVSLPRRDTREKCYGVVADSTEFPTRLVEFYSLTPTPGPDPNNRRLAPEFDDSLKQCIVTFRWRLGDAPGDQTIGARLVHPKGPEVIDDAIGHITVTAHAAPSLFIGAALLHQNARISRDSTETSQLEPVVGLDLPGYLPISRKLWIRRLRVTIATSIRDLGSDLHLGISWFPILVGPKGEGFLAQGYSGYRIGFSGREDSWVLFALTFNASSTLSTALGALK